MRVRLAALVMTALLTAAVQAAPPAGEGWEPLFNGKDLAGWKVPEGDGGHWKVIDGVIDYDAQSEAKGDRNLWSNESFVDFSLSIDWRFKKTTGLYAMPTVLPDGSYKTDEDGNVIHATLGEFVCSPDGTRVAYGSVRRGQRIVRTVDVNSGLHSDV